MASVLTTITLVAEDGELRYPDSIRDAYGDPGPALLVIHGDDCDSIRWPRPNRQHLRQALNSDREQGILPRDAVVLLPSGATVV